MASKPATILYPAHGGLIDRAAEFAQELQRRRGIGAVALVHGTKDAVHARRLGVFEDVVDVGLELRLDDSAANLKGNLQSLAAFERNHGGPSLWQFIFQDARWRFRRYSYPQLVEYLSHAARVLESVFARWDVIAALGELTSPVYRMVYQMCGRKRPYLVPMPARFFHRIYFDDDVYLRWDLCTRTYRRYMREGIPPDVQTEIAPVMEGIRRAVFRPVYFDIGAAKAATDSGLRRIRPSVWAHHAEDIWYYNIIDGLKNPDGLHWTYYLPPRKLARWLQWELRRRFYHRRALNRIPENTPCALFLPNSEPEYTIDVQGWPFADQAALVRTIAQSLPAEMTLLVKDHWFMVGPRSLNFYRRILELPNVRLVDERIHSQDLLRTAKLVFTVTGTIAMEATCCGVPTIMFGRVFSNSLEGVKVVRDLYELPSAVDAALKESDADYDRSGRAILAAIYSCSYRGRIDAHMLGPGEMPPENRTDLGDALEQELCRRGVLSHAAREEPLAQSRSDFSG